MKSTTLAGELQTPEHLHNQRAVLELTVNNHPGVMSHVCGLFSRRVFNVEGILCLPIDHTNQSRIWLLVDEDQRLEQMIKQLLKLEDVLDVRRHSADHEVFVRLEQFFQSGRKETHLSDDQQGLRFV